MRFDFGEDSIDIEGVKDGVLVGKVKADRMPFATTWVKQRGATALSAESVHSLVSFVYNNYKGAKREGTSAKKGTSDGYENNWFFFDGYDEAMTTFRDDPTLIRDFKVKEELAKMPPTIGTDVEFDVSGDYLDMGRYLDGEPEHWGVMKMGNPLSLFATIVLNLNAPCTLAGADLTARAQRVIRLVDWLENQQIRTQIKAMKSNQCLHMEVVVKQYDDVLDLDALAIAMNGDFVRRLCFRIAEWSPSWEYGYGTGALVSNGLMRMPEMDGRGILLFSENTHGVEKINENFDKAETHITKMLAEGEYEFMHAI